MNADHQAPTMMKRLPAGDGYRPLILRYSNTSESQLLLSLLDDPETVVCDTIRAQLGELIAIRQPQRKLSTEALDAAIKAHLDGASLFGYGTWVYYPWSHRIVHLLDEPEFIAVRTSRNQYKITPAEQAALSTKRIGVIGLSVGQAIAVGLAMERTCGELRLADFDTLELSNLNRVRSGVHTLGLPKTVVAAREIAELDPYLQVTCFQEGITQDNIDQFLSDRGELDLLVEVCEGLDVKILARQRAKAARIPVIMHSSDRGMLDVERFDTEPNRPLLHGLIKHLDQSSLRNLSTEEKVPYVLAMLGANTVSDRLKGSMLEVEQSIPSWPQLAHSVMLGGAAVTDAARRILLGYFTQSGRFFIDVEDMARDVSATPAPAQLSTPDQRRPMTTEEMLTEIERVYPDAPSQPSSLDRHAIELLVDAATRAPSGGNMQPWQWLAHHGRLHLFRDPSRSYSFLDVCALASTLALGAAAENFVLQAHAHGWDVQIDRPDDEGSNLVCSFALAASAGALRNPQPHYCDDLVTAITVRTTNRSRGPRRPIATAQLTELRHVVETIDGASLTLLTTAGELDDFTEIASAAERLRLLSTAGHRDFVDEIRWTPEETNDTRDGIDLDSLHLTPSERAGLSLARSPAVISLIKQWDLGSGFEDLTRKSIQSASCVGLLTMPASDHRAFFDGGRALQRFWLAATQLGVAVQPVAASTFMFARLQRGNDASLDHDTVGKLAALRDRFNRLFPVAAEGRGEIILVRMAPITASSTLAPAALRRPVQDVLTFLDHDSTIERTNRYFYPHKV